MLFLCEFWTEVLNRKWQIVDKLLYMLEFKVFFYNFQILVLKWYGFDPDPHGSKLLPGSGSKTQKIHSRIRIWNKSFRIHNSASKGSYNLMFRRAFVQPCLETEKLGFIQASVLTSLAKKFVIEKEYQLQISQVWKLWLVKQDVHISSPYLRGVQTREQSKLESSPD